MSASQALTQQINDMEVILLEQEASLTKVYSHVNTTSHELTTLIAQITSLG